MELDWEAFAREQVREQWCGFLKQVESVGFLYIFNRYWFKIHQFSTQIRGNLKGQISHAVPHLPHLICHPAAFSQQMLLNGRWLLDGVPSGVDGLWYDVLKMTSAKQYIFISRVLFIYEVAKRKAGKAQILRISPSDWDVEADICCFAADVMESMRVARDENNMQIFATDLLTTLLNNFLEGYLVLNNSFWNQRKTDLTSELF